VALWSLSAVAAVVTVITFIAFWTLAAVVTVVAFIALIAFGPLSAVISVVALRTRVTFVAFRSLNAAVTRIALIALISLRADNSEVETDRIVVGLTISGRDDETMSAVEAEVRAVDLHIIRTAIQGRGSVV